MRRFSLHRRSGVYYVQFIDPSTNKRLSARSTGTTNRDEALLVAHDWLKDGIPTGHKKEPKAAASVFSIAEALAALRSAPLDREAVEKIIGVLKERKLIVSAVVVGGAGAVLFSDYLRNFWTYEKSPYVADLHSVEKRMGRTHCGESLGRVGKYWAPFFPGRYLADITRADLKAFRLSLASAEHGLTALTRNRVLTVGTTALKWAFENDLIEEDPTLGLSAYAAISKTRGVLSPEETVALFKLEWKDERIKLGNLLAATTGLRVGEILALRREDIAERWLNVRHSYSLKDGLKTTKTRIERRVPLLPEIRAKLLELAE